MLFSQRFTRFVLLLAVALLLTGLLAHIDAAFLIRHHFEKQFHPEPGIATYLGEIHLNLFSGKLQIE